MVICDVTLLQWKGKVFDMTEVVVTNLRHPDAMKVRQEVFVEEQGFHDEFDDIDEIADHYLLYVDDEIAGCCRVFPSKDSEKYTLGRLAIRKKYRGKSYGSLIMSKVEEWIKQNNIPAFELSAQVRVRPFYEALGYVARGDEYLDENCPHIHMEKSFIL